MAFLEFRPQKMKKKCKQKFAKNYHFPAYFHVNRIVQITF